MRRRDTLHDASLIYSPPHPNEPEFNILPARRLIRQVCQRGRPASCDNAEMMVGGFGRPQPRRKSTTTTGKTRSRGQWRRWFMRLSTVAVTRSQFQFTHLNRTNSDWVLRCRAQLLWMHPPSIAVEKLIGVRRIRIIRMTAASVRTIVNTSIS